MIPMAFAPMAIGGLLGALTNKNPLKGGLLGAGMGALGGAAMPALSGMFGGAGAAGAAADPLAAYLTTGGAEGSIVGGGTGGAAGSVGGGGLFGGDTMKNLGGAAQIASASGVLNNSQQPIQSQPVQQGQGGAQVLGQLAQPQGGAQLQAMEQARMRRRQGLLGVA